jgi:hypothetical protein
MSGSPRVWLAGALGLAVFAALAPGARADIPRHHKRVAHAHPSRVPVQTGPIHRDDFLDVGSVPDAGSDQRYFADTKEPRYELGPGIFGRFESSLNRP